MADSDNSTTLPFVTRRTVLGGTAVALGTWGSCALTNNTIAGEIPPDPVVALWHQWQDAHHLTRNYCHRQQGLEQQLVETIGFPRAIIPFSDGEQVTVFSLEDIHEFLRLELEEAAACAKAEAEFAAHKLRWDKADQEIGYSAMMQAEREAGDRAEDLVDAMATTPATSLVGVAAKLDAVLRKGNIRADGSGFPWPQIRSALDDLARLALHGPQADAR
ncbi:hypothetical protein [Agrobacterium tumefaciens]|uniref:hypothetical protein n=1 Tax=Agrobacterium tumefaciens TaxID=358 RepID=UPI0021D1961F|nr:hypothetical protein [Agrobacterium tumefaciens]UXS05075.1 hypothetical protein FY156_26975 [Agrobacterium tumefaciens]